MNILVWTQILFEPGYVGITLHLFCNIGINYFVQILTTIFFYQIYPLDLEVTPSFYCIS